MESYKELEDEVDENWKFIYATIAYSLASAELENKPQSHGIGLATQTIYDKLLPKKLEA